MARLTINERQERHESLVQAADALGEYIAAVRGLPKRPNLLSGAERLYARVVDELARWPEVPEWYDAQQEE